MLGGADCIPQLQEISMDRSWRPLNSKRLSRIGGPKHAVKDPLRFQIARARLLMKAFEL